MSMIKFALLGLVLCLIRSSSEWQLTKCCPPGQIFVNKFTNCESVPLFAIDVYSHYWNITREFQKIPQCNEPEDLVTTVLDDFETDTVLEVPACLELFYKIGEKKPIIIIHHCRSNKDQQVKAIDASFPQLLHTRKCCFGDTIFDSRTKTCLTRLNETQSLGAFLLNRSTDTESAVILTHGPPKCQGPIVNYEINENDIFLRNNTYSVMIPVSKNNVKIKEEPVTEDNACLEMTPEFAVQRKLVVRICRDPEFCDTNACIRKCCDEDTYAYDGCARYLRIKPNEVGEFYNAFANAVNQTNSFTFDTTEDHGVLIQLPCQDMYIYNPSIWEKQVLLTSNGHVFIRNYDTNDMHCFEVKHNNFGNSSFDLFICPEFLTSEHHKSADWWFTILVIKCIFLLMTLLVYAYLPNLQNIHGKTIICYVSSILLTTILSFIINWDSKVAFGRIGKTSCKALAYIGFFSFHAVFFWLNVLCFDIWRTFGSIRENMNVKDRKNTKRLLLYCLYGWGMPFLMSILIIVVDNTNLLPGYLTPDIGNFYCGLIYKTDWNNYGDLIFGYGPVTIQLIFNVVFFIFTAKYYNKVKADIKNVNNDSRSKQFDSIKDRFIMIVKLFIIMGMQWIFDTTTYFLNKCLGYDNKWEIIYYIGLGLDCLEGLLIFIIFVLKKNVYQAIRKRLQDIK